MNIVQILLITHLAAAGGQARRLVAQGAVRVNGDVVLDEARMLLPGVYEVMVGRRVTAKVTVHMPEITVG
jgi:ribosomal protein S4